MTTRRHLLGLIFILPGIAPLLAWGSVAPTPGKADARIQTVDYDPEEVVALRVALGYSLTVEFSSDERIENVALGNSAVWQAMVNHRADHLFIKPMQGATNTNLTVITDAREYNFDLTAVSAPDGATPMEVRFHYPVVIDQLDKQDVPKAYFRISGSDAIRPTLMFDNDIATFIVWRDGGEIPAIFMINDRGREVLVNGSVRNGQYVIDLIANRFVFRFADQKATAIRIPGDAARPGLGQK